MKKGERSRPPLELFQLNSVSLFLIPSFEKLTSTQLVLLLILTLAVAFTVIVVSIGLVLRKIFQEHTRQREESLEKLYQGLILNYLFCDIAYDLPKDDMPRAPKDLRPLIEPIKKRLFADENSSRKEHFQVVRSILLDYSRELVGDTRARLILLFHELGLVKMEISLLRSRKWWLRAEAAGNLALMGAKVAMKGLLQATDDPHPDVRTEATQTLFDLLQENALPELLPLLKDLSQWMVIRLSSDILRLQSRAVPHMLEGLERREHTVQLLLLDLLGEISDLRAYDGVRTMTAKGAPEVRAVALVALGKLGDARGERYLKKALKDPDPTVRLGAVKGLQHLAAPSSVPSLRRALKDGDFDIRYNAGRALSLCSEPGKKALVRALRYDPPEAKLVAEEFLDELGHFDGSRDS